MLGSNTFITTASVPNWGKNLRSIGISLPEESVIWSVSSNSIPDPLYKFLKTFTAVSSSWLNNSLLKLLTSKIPLSLLYVLDFHASLSSGSFSKGDVAFITTSSKSNSFGLVPKAWAYSSKVSG